ncbi:hypothetical protein CEXT_503281 [Caerostris extrusa]|uniref:Uncharacterized protein n=1 Tax=Caerostris extrusa TaxID=172846 RepID=A0AAV4NYG4_CAEEX|nr:hypothetical protein CEXT_503281 [Caerostris extrusa]
MDGSESLQLLSKVEGYRLLYPPIVIIGRLIEKRELLHDDAEVRVGATGAKIVFGLIHSFNAQLKNVI